MRHALPIAVGLILSCNAANAGEHYAGFLTVGCGDRYIKLRNIPQTWYVNLSAEQERDVSRLANIARDSRDAWLTLHVELEASPRYRPRQGYFGTHSQQLDVKRVMAARYPEAGESVEAAIGAARSFKGYLLLADEMAGFVPLERRDEFWWIVPGKTKWEAIDAPFRQAPPSSTEWQIKSALVEVVGRVGPPGIYGHLGSYLREIAIDEFKFIRHADLAETDDTGAASGNLTADINHCKPQPR